MNELVALQMRFFTASILSGIILLVVYDMIRIFRRIIKHSGIMVAIEDILFWIAGSIFIFIMMYHQNNGIIRGFSILGMLFGMILYNQLLSDSVVNGMSKLIYIIINFIHKVLHFLLTPFRFILHKIKVFLQFINKKVGHFVKIVTKSVLKRLKNILKTVKISVTKK